MTLRKAGSPDDGMKPSLSRRAGLLAWSASVNPPFRAPSRQAPASPRICGKKNLQHAAEMDYHPNAIASMLSRSRTNIIGIVVSDMQNPFYPALIENLSRALSSGVTNATLSDTSRQMVSSSGGAIR
ncbi:hypothetical protein [Rhizobium sophorae]|uniref:hypothetical protein n=1 Tax=Rhizobium sophorae TaxID=1535242 RepID=UPI001FE2C440|nr:hypothetical protein [Rhizobium sophorae]